MDLPSPRSCAGVLVGCSPPGICPRHAKVRRLGRPAPAQKRGEVNEARNRFVDSQQESTLDFWTFGFRVNVHTICQWVRHDTRYTLGCPEFPNLNTRVLNKRLLATVLCDSLVFAVRTRTKSGLFGILHAS